MKKNILNMAFLTVSSVMISPNAGAFPTRRAPIVAEQKRFAESLYDFQELIKQFIDAHKNSRKIKNQEEFIEKWSDFLNRSETNLPDQISKKQKIIQKAQDAIEEYTDGLNMIKNLKKDTVSGLLLEELTKAYKENFVKKSKK